jgi:hypothetical protein
MQYEFSTGCPPPEAIERVPDPLLLSWVANNYRDANFPAAGADGSGASLQERLGEDRHDHGA